MSAAVEVPSVDPRFRAEMARLAGAAGALWLGRCESDRQLRVAIPMREAVGAGHALVLGSTGAGKTRVVAGIAAQMLSRIVENPASQGIVVVDHKGDLVALVRSLLGDLVERLPSQDAERLLSALVVVNPFSSTALLPLQILRPEPAVPAELLAYEVTTLLDRVGGADLGVRQDSFLYHLVLLGVGTGRSLPELADLLSDPTALVAAGASSPHADVRAYFAGAIRLASASLEGVRARLHRLLRLPAARLMLGARRSVSFRKLLASRIVLVDLGSPPFGCEDLARFWSGLVTLKLTRAIFERTPAEAARPVAVFVDEWQEGLAAGGDIAEHYERVLAMARSRGVSLWLISQSLATAARVSSSLPRIVATNTHLQFLFKSSQEDARTMAAILPVTGRRARAGVPPWEERSRTPYLTSREELDVLISEATQLPERVFHLWNRNRPYRAQLLRADTVEVRARMGRSRELAARLEDGALSVPLGELEADLVRRSQSGFRPIVASAAGATGAAATGRVPRRPRRER